MVLFPDHSFVQEIALDEIKKINTILPGIIKAYRFDDTEGHIVDVECGISVRWTSGVKKIGLIKGLRLAPYRFGDFEIMPPKNAVIGSPCKIEVSQRSLVRWYETGEQVDPEDMRMFNLSDSIVTPGAYPNGMSKEALLDSEGLIRYGDSRIYISKDGVRIEAGKMDLKTDKFDVNGAVKISSDDVKFNVKKLEVNTLEQALIGIMSLFKLIKVDTSTGVMINPTIAQIQKAEQDIKKVFDAGL